MRALRRTLATMALVVALASPIAASGPALANDPNALPVLGQPRFSARFGAHGSTLRVTGRLLDEKGRGLAGRTVQMTMNGAWLTSTRTSSTGSFNFSHQVPEGTMPDAHHIVISTKPGGGMTEAATSAEVVVGRLRQARLSASFVSSRGRVSTDLTLRGRVTDATGRPLVGVAVQGHFANGDWSDTFTTNARGDYLGHVTVPIGAAPGRHTLQVTVNGLAGYAAKPVPVVYTVVPGGPTPSPVSSPSASTSASVEDAGAADDPSPTPSAPPIATPTPLATGRTPATSRPVPPGAWGLGGLLGVGVLASVASLGRRLDDDEGDEGRLIGDPD